VAGPGYGKPAWHCAVRAAPGDRILSDMEWGRGAQRAGVLRPPRRRGVLARKRYSATDPGAVTGYAVGLPRHTAKDGAIVWYGGGKLAADAITLLVIRQIAESLLLLPLFSSVVCAQIAQLGSCAVLAVSGSAIVVVAVGGE